jgi:hypothetical protein
LRRNKGKEHTHPIKHVEKNLAFDPSSGEFCT